MFLFLSRDLKEKERHMNFARYICVSANSATRHSKGVARASISDFNRSVVRGWIWHATGSIGVEVLYTLLGIYWCSSGSEVHSGVEKHIRALPPWYVSAVPIFALSLIKDDMHLQFNELAKKHGSMFSVHLETRLVVLSDSRIVKHFDAKASPAGLSMFSMITPSPTGYYVFKIIELFKVFLEL